MSVVNTRVFSHLRRERGRGRDATDAYVADLYVSVILVSV